MVRQFLVCLGAATACLGSLHAAAPDTGRHQFIGWTNFADFHADPGTNHAVQLTGPWTESAIPWNEMVVSWNVTLPHDGFLETHVRTRFGDRPSRFYCLGSWSPVAARGRHHSVKGQADADGEVDTDVLRLRRPASTFQLRLVLRPAAENAAAPLKFLGVCLTDSQYHSPTTKNSNPIALAAHDAWGQTLAVPTRCQLEYDGGGSWCSPTSLSMVLAFWARRLHRHDLEWNVPDTAARVVDPQWPGTGNWSFNTAFAGSLPGLRACVSRLSSVAELELWIGRGMPVVTSVAYSVLQGRSKQADDGHLVVCVGFTETGDVVVNDPGTRWERRRIVPRADFAAAWAHSKNTVYLVYPEEIGPPPSPLGHW